MVQTARLKCASLNLSSSLAGMRHRRQTRTAVMLREAQSARMVFGASLSCAAASSVVRRLANVGPMLPFCADDACRIITENYVNLHRKAFHRESSLPFSAWRAKG